MLKRRRTLMLVAGLIAAVAVWWFAFRSPVVVAQVVTVTEGPLRITIDELGTTRVRAHADVNAPVNGRWVPASLREGDVITAGTLLGVLYVAPLDRAMEDQARARIGSADARAKEAEAALTSARAVREDAARNRARMEALGAVGGVSAQDVERARTASETADNDVQASAERLRAARFERSQAASVLAGAAGGTAGGPSGIRITSPLAGSILGAFEPHERVVPVGTRLFEVGDPRDLEVVVPVLTADAIRVRDGATARLTFGDASASSAAEGVQDTVIGRVVRVEPSAYTRLSALGVEEQRVNVVIAVPATAVHLGDHFRVDARITTWESARTLRMPATALVRDGDQWRAWRVRRGRAEPTLVRTGERGGDLVEIRDGLAAGDSVVLFPGEQLAPKVRVRAK